MAIKFKDFIERNSLVGSFYPDPGIRIDTVAGNYMKGMIAGKEFELFVHTVPMGRGIKNGRVYQLKLMKPREIAAVEYTPGYAETSNQDIIALYDRGWIKKPDTPEDWNLVERLVRMFSSPQEPRTPAEAQGYK